MSQLQDDYRQLHRRNQELMRYLAILVERAVGAVVLLASDLAEDRQLRKEIIGVAGAVRLTASRQ